MTRSCTAKARSSAKCPATNGAASRAPAPITASCGGIRARSCCSWGRSSARRGEWNFDRGLDWWLLDHAPHQGLRDFVRDLNRLYREREALHARDCESEGFEWIVVDDADSSVFAFVRFGENRSKPVVVVSNFTPVTRDNYRLGLPRAGRWREILNSDATVYGGGGLGNLGAIVARPERLWLVSRQRGGSIAAARDFVLRI